MQEMERQRDQLSSIVAQTKRMARKYGQIGLVEPDDIAQEVMLKVMNRKNGDSRPSGSWLYKAVYSSAMDAGRKASREKRFLKRDFQENELMMVSEKACFDSYRARPIDSSEDFRLDLYPELNNLLEGLSQPMRQTLLLYGEGYSYEEIARITKAKIGTIRSRLHHARRKARALLGVIS